MPSLGAGQIVLSAEDFRRLSHSSSTKALLLRDRDAQRLQAEWEEDKRIQEERRIKSQDLVSGWSHTVERQRQWRLETALECRQSEQKDRTQVIKEAEERGRMENEAIVRKAKDTLFAQTSRVRGLRSALLLSQVLEERKNQVEMKKWVGWEKEMEVEQLEILRRKEYEQEERERNRREKALKDAQDVAKHQRTQIEDRRKDRIREKEEAARLCRELFLLDERFIDDLQREMVGREEGRRLLRDMVKEQQRIKDMDREALAKKEQNEDLRREIRELADKRLFELRNCRQQDDRSVSGWQHAVLEKAEKAVLAQFKKREEEEDACIRRALQEQEKKQESVVRLKDNQREEARKSFLEHLKVQESLRKERSETAVVETEAERMKQEETLHHFLSGCHQEDRERLERNREVQAEQRKQINVHLKKKESEVQSRVKEGQRLLDELSLEEERFQEYASQMQKSLSNTKAKPLHLLKASEGGHEGGRGPILRERGSIRPLYMSSDTSGIPLPHTRRGKQQT